MLFWVSMLSAGRVMSGRSPVAARMTMGAASVPLTVIARRQDWLYVPPRRMSSSPGCNVFATFLNSSLQLGTT